MDCGPAALKCLLAGHGVEASYDRLREACQTDVDGTSIDVLEEVAVALGLDAEQVMIPPDHLLLPEAEALPALLVVVNAIGATHFVVVWKRVGPWVQVMDPATGRRWMSARALADDLYRHSMPVPAAAWCEWAGSDGFLRPLRRRLERLGVAAAERRSPTSTRRCGWSSRCAPGAPCAAAVRRRRCSSRCSTAPAERVRARRRRSPRVSTRCGRHRRVTAARSG